MQAYTNNTCGIDLTVQVPSTIDEAVKLFGEPAVLLSTIRQAFYGPWNSAFRREFVKKLEETTGVARRQQTRGGEGVFNTKKDGTKTPVLEQESKYLAFILESGAIDQASYDKLGQEVADTIKFEIPDADRQAAPAKEYTQAAKSVLAMVEAGVISKRTGEPVTEDSFTANFESNNPGFTLESLGGFTLEGVARALAQDAKRLKLESLNGLV